MAASWQSDAVDLTADPGRAAQFYTVGKLSDLIGLAPGTITDSITRAPITNPDNPRSAICRPYARIGRLPLWTKKQADAYLRIQRRQQESAVDKTELLEPVDVNEARERNLFSFVEYARMFSVHDQTLRRAQSQDGSFPLAVARRKREVAGVPEHLFPLDEMVLWARGKGYISAGFVVPASV